MQTGFLEQVRSKFPLINKAANFKEYTDKIRELEDPFEQSNDIVAYAAGRMYDNCMTNGRSNGYSNNDLITNPASIIESLIRHEILSEPDLICEDLPTVSGYSAFSFNDTTGYLISNINDHYIGAYLLNLTQDWVAPILDYIGSTKTIVVANTYIGSESDKYKVYNINSTIIDTASLDKICNTTNGTRKAWAFAKSIKDIDTFENISKKMLFESFTALIKSNKTYKLKTVFDTLAVPHGTLNKPSFNGFLPLITLNYTPIENIYTQFIIEYGYENGRNQYRSKFVIDNVSATTLTSGNFNDEQDKIKNAINSYGIIKKLEYQCDWIQDEATAVLFTKKLIDLYTKQRLIVTYTGDIKNHIIYECGDVVKIDYDKMIPASLNNSSQFMIQTKSLNLSKGNPSITFTLLEI